MNCFRHPSRSRLLRFVSRALILAFILALLPAPAHAARTNVQDLTRELQAPDLSSLAAPPDPHLVLCFVALVDGPDLQVWVVVPDPELAGNYHRARWMDPTTGRFTGMDPWAGSDFDPPSLHKYLYAANDPLNKIDPSGRQSMGELAAVGAMLGALTAIAIVQPRGVLETINVALSGALVGMAVAAVLAYAAGVAGTSLVVGAAGTAGTVGSAAARVAIVDDPILENTLARNSERLWLGEFYGTRFFERGQWYTWPGSGVPQAGLLWIQRMIGRFGGTELSEPPRSIEAMKPAINSAPQIVFNISNLSANSLALQEFNYIMANPALIDKTVFVTNVVVH